MFVIYYLSLFYICTRVTASGVGLRDGVFDVPMTRGGKRISKIRQKIVHVEPGIETRRNKSEDTPFSGINIRNLNIVDCRGNRLELACSRLN